MNKAEISLKILLKEVSAQVINLLEKPLILKLRNSIWILQEISRKWFSMGKSDFVKRSIENPSLESSLFGDSCKNEVEINERYWELTNHFNPEKSNWVRTPSDKSNLAILSSKIVRIYESLLKKIELPSDEEIMNISSANGTQHLAFSKDYHSAASEEWEKLHVLEFSTLLNLTKNELDEQEKTHLVLAIAEFRNGLLAAERQRNLNKILEFLVFIAECHYPLGNNIEAQLYALSCFMTLNYYQDVATQEHFEQAKRIFRKVKNDEDTANSQDGPSQSKLKKPLKSSELRNFTQGLFLFDNSKKNNVFRPLPLLQKRNQDFVNRGFNLRNKGFFNFLANIPLLMLDFVSLVSEKLFVGDKSREQENEIRLSLQKNIKEALELYDFGDMTGFVETLNSPVTGLNGEPILRYGANDEIIECEVMTKRLMNHGLRPDSVAFLLNLIGEVLASGEVQIDLMTQKAHKRNACLVFEYLFVGDSKNELLKSAKKLDEGIRMRKLGDLCENKIKDIFRILNPEKDIIFQKDFENYLYDEDIMDFQEVSYESRLKEVQTRAKINYFLIQILDGKLDEWQIFEWGKELLNKKSLLMFSKNRMEALQDFVRSISHPLFQMNVSKIRDKNLNEDSLYVEGLLNEDQSVYLSDLNFRLNVAESQDETEESLIYWGKNYVALALKEEKEKNYTSFDYWQLALKKFDKVMEINPENGLAFIEKLKCMLKMAQYSSVISLLRTTIKHPQIAALKEFWIIASIACRKNLDYKKSREYILEAKKIDHNCKETEKQIKILSGIEKNTIQKKIKATKKKNPIINEKYYQSRKKHTEYYRILSLDGGGIRGIIPAIWLMEIERRTHRPISHLFNMLAGTSTGAILSAGLSCPNPDHDYFSPRFRALDLVEIYRNGSEIFTDKLPLSKILNLGWAKYSPEGRKQNFRKYFDSYKLNDCLNDLVIPAVENINRTRTFLFSSRKARKDPSMNFLLTDALMATSAAPTYFSDHRIEGMGSFIDGGIHANNPALFAYIEALSDRNIDKEKIWTLSMGTASFIPKSLNLEGKRRGQIFWGLHLQDVTLPQLESNVDNQMCSILGKNYVRWQTWLEEGFSLDDCSQEKIQMLCEVANGMIEEMDFSEENNINKVVEFLDH